MLKVWQRSALHPHKRVRGAESSHTLKGTGDGGQKRPGWGEEVNEGDGDSGGKKPSSWEGVRRSSAAGSSLGGGVARVLCVGGERGGGPSVRQTAHP